MLKRKRIYKRNDIYKIANDLKNKYNSSDPNKICEELGIQIYPVDNLKSLLGMYTVILKRKAIIINSSLHENIKKIVIAHELAHSILHSNIIENYTLFKDFQLFDISSKPEIEANLFAAHLLIDDNYMFELIKSEYSDIEIAAFLKIDINLLLLKLSDLKNNNYNIRYIPKANFLSKLNKTGEQNDTNYKFN